MPRLAGDCADTVRREMLGRGFALVDTPRFFHAEQSIRFKKRWLDLPYHCCRWWKHPPLAQYGFWLERLLIHALAEESLALAKLECRHEPAGSVDQEVDRLHADGSYLRTVYTLFGPTTIYRDGKAELPVTDGQTLLMTAQDRARARRIHCTLHRRPGAGPERAVIVCSFVPCHESPRLPNVFRKVARTHRNQSKRGCP